MWKRHLGAVSLQQGKKKEKNMGGKNIPGRAGPDVVRFAARSGGVGGRCGGAVLVPSR